MIRRNAPRWNALLARSRSAQTGARARALLKNAEFADKDLGKAKPVEADIVGLSIPNKFVAGFGMDVYGYWRNLPGLWAIRPHDLKPAG